MSGSRSGDRRSAARGDFILFESLKLQNALIPCLAKRQDEEVFRSLAGALGRCFPLLRGIAGWADSWGQYSIVSDHSGEKTSLMGSDWDKLPGSDGWSREPVAISLPSSAGAPSVTSFVIPFRDGAAVVGFLGLEAAAAAPGEAPDDVTVAILSGAIAPLSALLLERIRESRLESMREMTATALQRSERRFFDFIEGSHDMIYIADGQDVIALVNRAGEELLGRPKREILGRHFSEFCHFGVDRAFFLDKLHHDGFARDFEETLTRADAEAVFVSESASAQRRPDGSLVEIHGIIRDITERLQSQKALWESNLELAAANSELKRTQLAMVQQEKLASIGQLAAGIAHEINNPLGFLISDFRALGDAATSLAATLPGESEGHPGGPLGDLISELPVIIAEMDDGFRRIKEIVVNLRTFARSDRDGAFSRYDLDDGLRRALVIARNEIKYVAEVVLNLGAPGEIEANAREIDQVLLNLLVNAAQAIGGENRGVPGRITVSSGLAEGLAWVEIADDGPGVPIESATRIFEPFFTTKDVGKGTGLGLSISYDIVARKHGGTLSLLNPGTAGAVFRVELPAAKGLKDGDAAT
ncbi:MAG: PAS domain S-box protein [Spirochaetaceae bacterium]|nr:PAS domain S-box protein [Spirochaetaceae bacterium]